MAVEIPHTDHKHSECAACVFSYMSTMPEADADSVGNIYHP